mmetsp:Transcript_24420/g.40484  ORF Transcript_24420/g.40484 Transcript_24420/m.40484 type:complete len:140 (-) Transcript_24420:1038-1457(-)
MLGTTGYGDTTGGGNSIGNIFVVVVGIVVFDGEALGKLAGETLGATGDTPCGNLRSLLELKRSEFGLERCAAENPFFLEAHNRISPTLVAFKQFKRLDKVSERKEPVDSRFNSTGCKKAQYFLNIISVSLQILRSPPPP